MAVFSAVFHTVKMARAIKGKDGWLTGISPPPVVMSNPEDNIYITPPHLWALTFSLEWHLNSHIKGIACLIKGTSMCEKAK